MKLSIVKTAAGAFECELHTSSGKKPERFTIEPNQIETLVKLLNTAKQATKFAFTLEL